MSNLSARIMAANEAKLSRAEAAFGYSFSNDRTLLWEALQIAGSGVDRINGRYTVKGNQRLAVHGDSVMQAVLCQTWYQDTSATQADWTRLRVNILSNDGLAEVCETLDLVNVMYAHPRNPPPTVSNKLRGTLMEAIIGAIAIDGGFDAARQAMEHVGLITPVTMIPLPNL